MRLALSLALLATATIATSTTAARADSDVTDGAVEADLRIDEYVRITPLADGFVQFLNGAGGCGEGAAPWAVGQVQDIQAAGCAPLGLPHGSTRSHHPRRRAPWGARRGHAQKSPTPVRAAAIAGAHRDRSGRALSRFA